MVTDVTKVSQNTIEIQRAKNEHGRAKLKKTKIDCIVYASLYIYYAQK